MLLNYLKLSLRLMARNPFFTFINLTGLSVGFAVFFILWPYTQSELKSDEFIPDHDRIVRMLFDFKYTDNNWDTWGSLIMSNQHSHIASEISNQYPDFSNYTRFTSQFYFDDKVTPGLSRDLIVSVENNGQLDSRRIERSICADQNFFEFFELPLVNGSPKSVLDKGDAVLLSESLSKSLFGNNSPVGKSILVNNKSFEITGVFQDVPKNSHFEFDLVFSNLGRLAIWNDSNGLFNWVYQYFKTDNVSKLELTLNTEKANLIGDYLRSTPNVKIEFFTQPLSAIV